MEWYRHNFDEKDFLRDSVMYHLEALYEHTLQGHYFPFRVVTPFIGPVGCIGSESNITVKNRHALKAGLLCIFNEEALKNRTFQL